MPTNRSIPTNREPIHPGEILLHEFRIPLGLTQEELAVALDIDRPAYSAIENGKRSITPRLAVKLERVLRMPAIMWLSMQTDVDLYRARHSPDGRDIARLRPIVASPSISARKAARAR